MDFLENGFAHYYVAHDGILQAEDDINHAWHCGDTNGNNNYLSIEVCQSMGNIDIFKSKEEKALQLAAQKCKQYGIEQNQNTIRLHQEMYATSCPHRSVEIHGGASGCNWNDPKMVRMVTQDALVFQWIDSSCSNKKSPVEIPGDINCYCLNKKRET